MTFQVARRNKTPAACFRIMRSRAVSMTHVPKLLQLPEGWELRQLAGGCLAGTPAMPDLRNIVAKDGSSAFDEIDRMRATLTSSLHLRPTRRSYSPTPIPTSPLPIFEPKTVTMASIIARRAFGTTARRLTSAGEEALKVESKKNPEIMVRQIPTATPNPGAPPATRAGTMRRHEARQLGGNGTLQDG